jgi:hypothetical protein
MSELENETLRTRKAHKILWAIAFAISCTFALPLMMNDRGANSLMNNSNVASAR